jgi:hypothetical protein
MDEIVGVWDGLQPSEKAQAASAVQARMLQMIRGEGSAPNTALLEDSNVKRVLLEARDLIGKQTRGRPASEPLTDLTALGGYAAPPASPMHELHRMATRWLGADDAFKQANAMRYLIDADKLIQQGGLTADTSDHIVAMTKEAASLAGLAR